MFSQQIFPWKALRHCEALRSFADQHHVTGVLHHGLGQQRHILDVAHAADRAGAPRWSVHAGGVEFDDTFFVREPAEPYAVVIGIIFLNFPDGDGGIERVLSALEHLVAVIDTVPPIRAGDKDWRLR